MLAIKALTEVRNEAERAIEYSRESGEAFGHSQVQGEWAVSPAAFGSYEGVGDRSRPLVPPCRTGPAEPSRKRRVPTPAPYFKLTEDDFEEEDLEAAEDELLADYYEGKKEVEQAKLEAKKRADGINPESDE